MRYAARSPHGQEGPFFEIMCRLVSRREHAQVFLVRARELHPKTGVTPKSETVRKCTLSRKGAASGECKRSEVSRAGVLASCGGADEARGEYGDVGQGTGSGSARVVPMATTAGPGETTGGQARAGSRAGQGSRTVEAGFGGEGVGVGFFQRCLAQNRGATPGGRKHR